MDTTTNQRQGDLLNIDDLVLIKTPRISRRSGDPMYLLYQLERIDTDAIIQVRRNGEVNRGYYNTQVDRLYIFKPVLSKAKQKSKNYKRRRIPEEWLKLNDVEPYAIKLEDYIRKNEEEIRVYKKVFIDHFTKINATRELLSSTQSQ